LGISSSLVAPTALTLAVAATTSRQAGGISRGAERLHVSQPAVSKQIKELEDALGFACWNDCHAAAGSPMGENCWRNMFNAWL
jgi:hypothetical protein